MPVIDATISPRKIAIIGAGRVGSHCALCLMARHLVNEIVFIDVNEEYARAQAMDLDDLATGFGDSFVIRVGTYDDLADAHFAVMTAGRSRRPGETRLEMLDGSIKVLDTIVGPLRDSGFHGILISVSNPADIVVEYLYRKLDLPRGQVFGTGTSLDSARLRRLLSQKLGVDRNDIQAFCMGEHGDSSFIAGNHMSIGGLSLRKFERLRGIDQLDLDDIARQVTRSGGQIVQGKGATEFGIGSVVSDIVMTILHNGHRVMPLSVHLEGEYGQYGISVSTPCLLGPNGIEDIFDADLTARGRELMEESCNIIREKVLSVMPEA